MCDLRQTGNNRNVSRTFDLRQAVDSLADARHECLFKRFVALRCRLHSSKCSGSNPFERSLIERQQDRPIGREAFGHFQAQIAGHQRRWTLHVEVVLLEAMFVGDFQRIAETGGGDQCGSSTVALDQRIGRNGYIRNHRGQSWAIGNRHHRHAKAAERPLPQRGDGDTHGPPRPFTASIAACTRAATASARASASAAIRSKA